MSGKTDCCSGGECGDVDRREFLKTTAGLSAAAASLGAPAWLWAAQERDPAIDIKHLVPAEKKLSTGHITAILKRGRPEVHRGEDLDTIGMPIGGIGAGQLYLLGDGRLGCWQIFNEHRFSGYGADNYRRRALESPVEQGFAVLVDQGGKSELRRLDRTGFPGVRFTGEHPIARVEYRGATSPVAVELEAFSPFIPLNTRDSTLPATIFTFRLKNATRQPVQASLLGWLENAVCRPSEGETLLDRVTRVERDERGRTFMVHSGTRPEVEPPVTTPPRPPVVLADFEGTDYGDWKATGDAFGPGPASGTLPRQQKVTGFLGKGLVNTFRNLDASEGTLTSPPFSIERDYLNLLVGGGRRKGRTAVNLLVDGKVVRWATGRNDEKLDWRTWYVKPLAGQEARIQIVDRSRRSWGHLNVDHIELADRPRIDLAASLEDRADFGTLALAFAGPAQDRARTEAAIASLEGARVEIVAEDPVRRPNLGRYASALLTRPVTLAPGEEKEVRFVLAWHFPNLGAIGIPPLVNHMYARRFADARGVAGYVLDHVDRLVGDTRKWHAAFHGGTLPRWLLARLHSTVGNLATGTCYYLENGRFWGWEGVGCCAGTCTHVWNYAQAPARLFPALERSVREKQDLGVGFQADGLVSFRGESHQAYAADGQAGTILKCYREHRMSGSDLFLERNWPRIRKALEYLLRRDGNDDGLIEDGQHNTYDVNFHGANTFVGSLYLAALRAGEEMARERGDDAFAARLHRVFEQGSRHSVKRLFNGEYFVQDVDLKKHPKHQYGDGCLADQLFGQGWAHQLGLGYLYPRDKVQKALDSVWKYNWAPDVGPQNEAHKPQRWFARPGEAGLFTCTWPKSPHLGPDSVLYRDEVWTGIEYQVAGHLVREGQAKRGLAMVRAIHDRYHPRKRNPFNEVECGDHYARALASWGVYLALLGFDYHGPRGHLRFSPRLAPAAFQAAFTTAEGWGTFTQSRQASAQKNTIAVDWGRLRLKRLTLDVPDGLATPGVKVTVQDRPHPLRVESRLAGGRLVVDLAHWLTLVAGEVLEVRIESA